MTTVKDLCDALGITTLKFFQQAYGRYGLLYSIGGPEVTHARYLKEGVIPIYVQRYKKDVERLLMNLPGRPN